MLAAGVLQSRLRLLLALLFLIIGGAVAGAQQPFVTDDADTTPKRHFHFEFSNQFDVLQRSSFPSRDQNTADFELDYGLLENVELDVEIPIITIFNTRGIGSSTVSGPGDTNFSLKYNFLKEHEHSRWPAMAITFNLEVPTGSVKRQLGSGLSDFYVNGILQKSISGKTKLRLNGGILFSGNQTTGLVGIKTRGTVFTGGGSLVRRFTKRLQLGVEVTGAVTKNFQLGKGQLQTQLGGNYQLRPNFSLDFGIVAGKYAASPRVGAQLGVSIDF